MTVNVLAAPVRRDWNPDKSSLWTDLGDLELPEDFEQALPMIRAAAAAAIRDGSKLLSIGGDHLVAWPVVQAVTDRYEQLTIVRFDAHPDLYDQRSRLCVGAGGSGDGRRLPPGASPSDNGP